MLYYFYTPKRAVDVKKNQLFILFCFLSLLTKYSSFGQEYIHSIQHYSYEEGLNGRFINSIIADSDSIIWLLTNEGVSSFDGHHFNNYASSNSTLRFINYKNIYYTKDLILLEVFCYDGVNAPEYSCIDVFDKKTMQFLPIVDYLKIDGLQETDIVQVISKNDEAKFLKLKDGAVISIKSKSFIEISASFPQKRKNRRKNYYNLGYLWPQQFKSTPGYYWDCKHQSIIIRNEEDEIIIDLASQITKQFPQVDLNCLFIHKGKGFIGTTDGLIIFEMIKNRFQNYLSSDSTPISTRGFIEIEDDIYVGTYSGLAKIEPINREAYIINPVLFTSQMIALDSNILTSSNKSTYLRSYAPSFQKENYAYLFPDNFDYFTNINCLFLDHNEQIWLGTNRGLFRFDPIAQKTIPFDLHKLGHQYQYPSINHIHENEAGLWLGTSNGLILIRDDRSATIFNTNNKKLPYDHIYYIYEEDQLFWLPTKGGGLIKWNFKDYTSKHYTTLQGLSNNTIYAAYSDTSGYLWLPSNYGLMQFDKQQEKVFTYLPKDGITHIEFNYLSHFQSSNGILYFGGLNGITAFNPSDFGYNKQALGDTLMITEIEKLVPKKGAFQKIRSTTTIDHHIRLSPNENAIKVQVSLLNFSGLKNNRYAYKLSGHHKEWNYTSLPEINISNLSYGSQTLHIKAQSAEGLPSKNEISLIIFRERPFYLKWWFASTCILFCSGVFFYSLYLVRKNRERLELLVEERTETISNQAKELEQLNEQQSNFFVNVSHELRTPISLILGPLNSLRKEQLSNTQKTNLGIIERNTKRLQLMIDELLAFAKLNTEIAESTQKVIDLQSFILELSLDYIPLADKKELEFSFNSNIPEDVLIILDTEKVNRIAGNLIQNAIKFTPEFGKITINAILKEDTFLFQVIDNGEGIREEDINNIFKRYFQTSKSNDLEGLGVGLSLSKELAESMRGELSVSSTHQKGSTFNLLLPIEKSVQSIFSSQEATTLNINLPFNPKVAHQPHTSKPTILVIEDHPDMLTYLTSIFEDDYIILKARNGVEAIQLINNMKDSSTSVQLIISDIMMPGIDGLQFFHILQHNQNWRNVPFIFLTAKNNPSEKIEALRIGVDDYLTKPFTEEELKARAQNLIQRYTDRIQFTALEKKAPKTEVENLDETPEWIKDATNIIKAHAHDTLFNVEQLAIKLMMSRRQLFRKMKSTTGLTPNKFMQEVRLQLAKEILESTNTQSVQEVSLAVGFKKANYFSQLYKSRFGRLPSSYL